MYICIYVPWVHLEGASAAVWTLGSLQAGWQQAWATGLRAALALLPAAPKASEVKPWCRKKKKKNDANCYSEAALHLKAGFNALHVHANLGEWCRYSVAEHS